MIRRLWWGSVAWLIAVAPAGAQVSALERTFYEYGVAGYCGLVTDTVQAGFQREVDDSVARDGLDDKAVDVAHGNAWTAVEKEWSNLGGVRGWCRTEGKTAAERFMDAARKQPEG